MWQNYGNASSQSVFIKAAYVQGAIEGLRVGSLVGYLDGRMDEKSDTLDNVKQCVSNGPCAGIPVANLIKTDAGSSFNEAMTGADRVRAKLIPGSASVLDIVHQMDKFYADYRNTPVCMIQALQESIQSLNGTPSAEKDLDLMRKQGCPK